MKGPAIFLAQFAGSAPPFDKLETMAQWAAGLGYVGVQVPTDPKLFDLEQAAKSQTYCDEIAGKLADADVVISELSTHLQGQLVAVHPAYAPQFAAFAPAGLRDKPSAWQEWATIELKHPEDGAREGAPFIREHMIRTTTKAFDDFAASSTDPKVHARILGLDQ